MRLGGGRRRGNRIRGGGIQRGRLIEGEREKDLRQEKEQKLDRGKEG